jgi:hypothetical protein
MHRKLVRIGDLLLDSPEVYWLIVDQFERKSSSDLVAVA